MYSKFFNQELPDEVIVQSHVASLNGYLKPNPLLADCERNAKMMSEDNFAVVMYEKNERLHYFYAGERYEYTDWNRETGELKLKACQ